MRKTVIVLGGPNGAGKTTLARQLLLDRLPDAFEFLNADFIAEGISPFRPQKAALRAGKEFVGRFDELADRGKSFVVESTLSGESLASRLSGLRTDGYALEMVYLWLPSVEVAVRRVRERVKQGGHDIPIEVIERRFERSYPNFLSSYSSIADRWTLLDGNETPPREIAVFGDDDGPHFIERGHSACRSLMASLDDRVGESSALYGRSGKFYTEDIGPVLTAVGEFLRQLETAF